MQTTVGASGQPPGRRTDARRNRKRILEVARAAFAGSGEVSMAEIARRSGVGSATLYRNFPARRDLLEALYVDEVDAVCAAASTVGGESAGDRFTAWLERFNQFVTSKHPVAVELLGHVDRTSPVFGASRERVVAAGTPLLRAAQDAGQVQAGLSLDQILDMIVALGKIPGGPAYAQPILRTALSGLSHPPAR